MAKSKRSLGAQRSTASPTVCVCSSDNADVSENISQQPDFEGQEALWLGRPFSETSGPSWWLNQPNLKKYDPLVNYLVT